MNQQQGRVGERGQVIPLVALMIVGLVMIVALAVDGGALFSQRRDYQRAADAAALGGVQRLVTSGSEEDATDRALELLMLNGVAVDSVQVVVTAVDDVTLRVEIDDPEADLYFAGVIGATVGIGADATATLSNCGAACGGVITPSVDHSGFDAPSEGDGWTPELADDRIFALNHHIGPSARNLMCVERDTQEGCDGYPVQTGTYTNDISELQYVPATDDLWFAYQDADRFGVSCWESSADRSCGTIVLADLPLGTQNERLVRGSYPVLVGDRLWVTDDDHRVHCIDPATRSVCAGSPYASSQSGAPGIPVDGAALWTASGGGWFPSRDVEVVGDRIYTSLEVRGAGRGTAVSCFDTSIPAACPGWPGDAEIADVGQTWDGRYDEPYLFVRHDRSGQPDGICAHARGEHSCLHLRTGALLPDNPSFATFQAQISKVRAELHLDGRTYFADQLDDATVCWDWLASASCGRRVGGPELDPDGRDEPDDYGYVYDGTCIIGLGDAGYFFGFDRDLQPCGGGNPGYPLDTCTCHDGRTTWGVIEVAPPAGAGLAGIDATLVDDAGAVVWGPTDLDSIGGRIDLDSLGLPAPLVLRLDLDGSVWSLQPSDLTVTNHLVVRPTLVD